MGFIAGYLLGTRDGREKIDELREAWQVVASSKEAQIFVMAASTLLTQAVENGRGQGKESSGDGVVPEFQTLHAGGSSLLTNALKDVFGQGKGLSGNGVAAGIVEQLAQAVVAAMTSRRAS